MADTFIEKIYIIYYIVYICYIINLCILHHIYCIDLYIVFLNIIYTYIHIYIKSISTDQTLALVYIQFLSLSTNDILDQIGLCCGGVACALQDT